MPQQADVMQVDGETTALDEQARRLAESLRRQLGPLGCQVMQEPGVFELMLNLDGRLWAVGRSPRFRHGTDRPDAYQRRGKLHRHRGCHPARH